MRSLLGWLSCVALLASTALLGGRLSSGPVKVRLRLVDNSGKNLAGIVRVFEGKKDIAAKLPGLFDRLKGLKVPPGLGGWYVVPSGAIETSFPPTKIRLEALSGLETELARRDIDLGSNPPREIVIKLRHIFRPGDLGLVAGNTHLHLRGFSLEDASDYLRQIPPADGLRILFISYLERHEDDKSYITNRYPVGDLPQFAFGTLIQNGQEHRHNFKPYGQGYGHVMFLNIKKLVQPVSLGPGITALGFDDRPLLPGIEEACKQGGTIIWCHNTFGYEDVVQALAGRLDALNVFDGSRTGRFEDNYYPFLNIGLRMPISTGTDWFLYDFSRVYARVEGKLGIPSWLEAVKAGRCQATNGPLLTLVVDGRKPGDIIQLNAPRTVRIEASAAGRHDFQQLQLIHNGKVVKAQTARGKNPFHARLVHDFKVEGPGWFALRIDGQTKNEFDRPLYAHTSPVYVDFAGKKMFDVDSALILLKQIEEGRAAIKAQGKFSSRRAEEAVLALYDDAAGKLRGMISKGK